jgi:hypothetical protein
MLHALFASSLLLAPVGDPATGLLDVDPPSQVRSSIPAVDLGEVVSEGRRLEDMTRAFVREVAAPSNNRGLARWRDGVCVGVANLQNELSQYIVDRVSTIAADVGLRPGYPGCTPSIVIVAVADANTFTPAFVERRQRLFRVGGAGMDRGMAALERFKTNDQPVRWWIVSAPIDADTGQLATRLPGLASSVPTPDTPSGDIVTNYAPVIATRQASRLSTQIVDDTKRAFVVIDMDRIGEVSAQQLADYVAFVALAQIDPEADTSGFATILNVFDDPTQSDGLTQWDRAYLQGLYSAVRTRRNLDANASEIIASIVTERRAMENDDEGSN